MRPPIARSTSVSPPKTLNNLAPIVAQPTPPCAQGGFLFFDITDVKNPLRGAHFYLTGVRDSSGNDLMYFEVPLEKYTNAASH